MELAQPRTNYPGDIYQELQIVSAPIGDVISSVDIFCGDDGFFHQCYCVCGRDVAEVVLGVGFRPADEEASEHH